MNNTVANYTPREPVTTVTLGAWTQGGRHTFTVTGTCDQLIAYALRSGAEITETEELRVVADGFTGPWPLDVVRLLDYLYPQLIAVLA